jgi:hypothetical protein
MSLDSERVLELAKHDLATRAVNLSRPWLLLLAEDPELKPAVLAELERRAHKHGKKLDGEQLLAKARELHNKHSL